MQILQALLLQFWVLSSSCKYFFFSMISTGSNFEIILIGWKNSQYEVGQVEHEKFAYILAEMSSLALLAIALQTSLQMQVLYVGRCWHSLMQP